MSAAKSAGNPVKQNTQNVRQQKSLGVRLCNVGALLVVLVAIAIGFFYPDESAVFATKVLVKTGATYVRLQDPPDYKGPSAEARVMMKLVSMALPEEEWSANNFANVQKHRRILESPLERVSPTNVSISPVTLITQRYHIHLDWFNVYGPSDPRLPIDKAVVFVQGGGFLASSKVRGRLMSTELSRLTGLPVLNAHYRPLPNGTVANMVEDLLEVRRYLTNMRGIPFDKVVLVGSSAGCTLSLLLTEKQISINQSLPAGIVCISPWATEILLHQDAKSWESFKENANKDKMLPPNIYNYMASAYDMRDTRNTILRLDKKFDKFPPMFITAGGYELTRDGIVAYAKKLEANGVAVELKVYPYMPHAFQTMHGYFPEADEGMKDIANWIRKVLSL